MDRRALHHALEAGGRLGLFAGLDDEVFEFAIDVARDVAAQRLEIDVAGAQHGARVGIIDQRQQQVLERRKFVPPFVRYRQRLAQRLF